MAYEELFQELLKCEKEEDVSDVIKLYGFEKYDDVNWLPFGGVSNNYGVIGTQQADPLSALIEKIINSIDAVLMRECLKRNLDPTGLHVPRNMDEAAEVFLDIPDGNLAKLDATERTKLAENNINLVITGMKPNEGNPCVIVIDRGEGQYPKRFKETFLSLNKSNKISIPFVQGKFNMGGTGSLLFCGTKNYQLVASKRNVQIEKYDGLSQNGNSNWGFTLIRKRPPLKNERSSRFEYLAPKGTIIELNAKEINALPNKDNTPYQLPLESGSIVKLYEYQLPGSTKTMANADLYRALSNKLWKTIVPIRIIETRDYKGHTLGVTLSGMNIRLEEDKGGVLENDFPTTFKLRIPNVGVIEGQICLFKKDAHVERWMSPREAIIFTINGQSHGAITNDFFRRNSVKLPWLQKELLINIDCSRLDHQLIERLFMTSRDRLRESDEKSILEETLADHLRKHEGLRYWNEKRHQQLIEDKFKNQEETTSLFETIIASNPNLADFLGFGMNIKIPKPGNLIVDEFKGQRFPTFLKIENENGDDIFIKQCPQNSFCRIKLLTDAENDYLTRAFEPGQLIIRPEEIVKSVNLYNGRLEIQIEPSHDTPIGHFHEIKIMLSSPNAIEGYFSVKFKIEITAPIIPGKKDGQPKTPPKNNSIALPQIIEVYKNDWGKYGDIENEDDYVTILKDTNDTTSFINMDNKHYRSYVYNNPKKKDILKNLHLISATIIGLSIEDQLEKGFIDSEKKRQVLSAFGKLVLPLVDSLGEIKADL